MLTIADPVVGSLHAHVQQDAPEAARDTAAKARARAEASAEAWRIASRFFLGPVLPLLDDPEVTEIMVNGPDEVFVERGRVERVSARFRDDAAVLAAARHIGQFIGRRIDPESPIMDGRLPTGERVCIVLAPVCATAATINIRKYSTRMITPAALIDSGAVTTEALEYLRSAVSAHANIVVCGGAGTGKTTLLNILAGFFAEDDRIILMEDTRELQVRRPHLVRLESRPPDRHGRGGVTLRDLFVASLRMRPDRIVVGEVRREEALDLVQAMSSGHRGSLSTLHASNPVEACLRLETLAMMAGLGLPLAALRRQVGGAVDLLVQLVRGPDGRRRVTNICEVSPDPEFYELRDIFTIGDRGGGLVRTGLTSRIVPGPAGPAGGSR